MLCFLKTVHSFCLVAFTHLRPLEHLSPHTAHRKTSFFCFLFSFLHTHISMICFALKLCSFLKNFHFLFTFLFLTGGILSLMGVLFKAMISRKREFEADACSLAFTHNHKFLQVQGHVHAKQAKRCLVTSANSKLARFYTQP